jgi:hypothetical protein
MSFSLLLTADAMISSWSDRAARICFLMFFLCRRVFYLSFGDVQLCLLSFNGFKQCGLNLMQFGLARTSSATFDQAFEKSFPSLTPRAVGTQNSAQRHFYLKYGQQSERSRSPIPPKDWPMPVVYNGPYDIFLLIGRCATYLADRFRSRQNCIALQSLPCLALLFV